MSQTPLEWIKLELLPLPGAQDYQALVLWWNPQERVLEGEGKEVILDLVTSALDKGSLQTGSGAHIEVTDPLHKPSELAAVLAQYYWVIPQPVAAAGEDPMPNINNTKLN